MSAPEFDPGLQIVMPMAGDGRRFMDAGYQLPKPLIPVSGLPMFARVLADLPAAARVVCICQRAHVERFGIDRALSRHAPGVRVVVAPGLTQGQACSVALAGQHLDRDAPVIVASCDNTHLYSRARLAAMTADPSVGALIWTYRGEPRVALNPAQYGFVRVVPGTEDVAEVACKRAISPAPQNDHVVSGFFWFRTAGLMLDGIAELVRREIRTNNEFYMDVVPNILIEQGRRVAAFEVEKYIGWGTPADLVDYQRWERYFESIGPRSRPDHDPRDPRVPRDPHDPHHPAEHVR